jgi:hypothetical protein
MPENSLKKTAKFGKMELNDYSWFIYALTLMLTLSICFIIILVIVKCAEACYETQLFCCKKKQANRSRHHRRQRRRDNSTSEQANANNSSADITNCRSIQSLQSHSCNFDDNISTSTSSSSSSNSSSNSSFEEAPSSNHRHHLHSSIRQHQQTTESSILNLDHSSIVFIPNLFYNNMAFDNSNVSNAGSNSTSVCLDQANNLKANRKCGVRDRFAQAYLKSAISTPISLQINRNHLGSLSTVSGHVDCFHQHHQSSQAAAAIIAIDLNQTKLKYCSSQPPPNTTKLACLSINNSGAGFLVNTGHSFLISNEVLGDDGVLNSSKVLAGSSDLNDANSSIRGGMEEDEIPPPYEQIVRESIV